MTPVMTADSSGTDPGSTGTLNLSIYRPERLALPSETSATGIMDQTGLHYSVKISQAIERQLTRRLERDLPGELVVERDERHSDVDFARRRGD